jgi:hypothetical protein
MRAGELIDEDSLRSGERPASPADRADLYQMANLGPKITGLPFVIWVSPRGRARHDARIKVSIPLWEANPIAVYSLRPFAFVEGVHWLPPAQTEQLAAWMDLNAGALIDFWEGRILLDDDLKDRLIGIGDAPLGNYKEAIVGLRASAPKMKSIRWFGGAYHLTFGGHVPKLDKISARFADLGFVQPIQLHDHEPANGILLWRQAGAS